MDEIKRISSIIKVINFQYTNSIEYDYRNIVAHDHDIRCADDYCRCSTIEDCVITKVNALEFAKTIKEYLGIDTNTELFNIDIINICKNIISEDFIFNICCGYYGEELDGITLESHMVNKLSIIFSLKAYRKEKLKNIESKIEKDEYMLDEYIKKILTEEYGYVLDSLKNSKFRIIEISPSDIEFPQKNYNEFVKRGDLLGYKNKKDICGLVKKINNKYIVIDGYHRINANLDKKTIKVILAY